ncbi:sulfite exporter TauE/SafE family protein [Lacticaseibacillus sp. GG6-2]
MFVMLIVIGFLVGMFVIALGGGGAAIYLGVLTAGFGLSAHAAASTSLVTALPSLALGAYVYWRQGSVDVKLGNRMLIAALPAVVIGSLLAPFIPKTIYSWGISLILIALGLNILLHKTSRIKTSANNKWLANGAGILAGLMVGIAGMSGGGAIVAGLLLMGMAMINVTATSSYVLVFMSLVGALLHMTSGTVDWVAGFGLMIGSLGGALVAPLMMKRLTTGKFSKYLKPLMGMLLIVMGMKTLI